MFYLPTRAARDVIRAPSGSDAKEFAMRFPVPMPRGRDFDPFVLHVLVAKPNEMIESKVSIPIQKPQ